jgi:hypothetical protein
MTQHGKKNRPFNLALEGRLVKDVAQCKKRITSSLRELF